VKAAFLHRFSHFVTWPGNTAAGDTLLVGIVGTDPFGSVIDRLFAGKPPGGRTVVLRRFASFDDVSYCHILFVGATDRRSLLRAMARLRHTPVLTVGEQSDFLAVGGIIRLKVTDDRVRFDVNVAAADSAHLRLSSELLRVADTVKGQGPAGGVR
jgi:hypothetical protein